MSGFMSPIERWGDRNYAPAALTYVFVHAPGAYRIVAPLHGFHARDVKVDLVRGHVIILLAREYRAGANLPREYYCEVPIPADADDHQAAIDIHARTLTVRLEKRSSRLQTFVRRLKQDAALLLGQGWMLDSLDD